MKVKPMVRLALVWSFGKWTVDSLLNLIEGVGQRKLTYQEHDTLHLAGTHNPKPLYQGVSTERSIFRYLLGILELFFSRKWKLCSVYERIQSMTKKRKTKRHYKVKNTTIQGYPTTIFGRISVRKTI